MTENISQGFRTESRNELATLILDSITAEVAVLDEQGNIIAVNDAWNRFARENGGAENTTGVGVNYFQVCRSADAEDRQVAEQACQGILRVIEGAIENFKLEYPCHSPAEQRWFLLFASRLKAAERCAVVTHLSITERKLTEEKLVASERLAAIGEAMRGLSHEGRNALQRAQASIELLQLHLEQNGEALEFLNRIEVAHNHLLELYEEVTNYAGPINLQARPYPLDNLVDEVWRTVARDGARIKNNCDGRGNLTCEIDVDSMRTVLLQLFQNALDACDEHTEIQVSYRVEELDGKPALTLILSDTGSGIPRAQWETVFQPFHTTKLKGTGLGLAIARRYVNAHAGCIQFGEPILGGASIYMTLPKRRQRVRGG